MKMLGIGILILVFCWLSATTVGCVLLRTQPAEVGVFSYLNQPAYTGPVIRDIPIWVDKNFGMADRLEIDRAVSAWNHSLNGYIKLHVVDWQFDMEIPKIQRQVRSGGWLFMRIESDNPMVEDKEPGFQTIGFTDRVGGTHLYLVRNRLENYKVFGVTLHEIGHLLGSSHVGNRLMAPHFDLAGYRCVDYDSLFTVAGYRKLPFDHLNYCLDKETGKVVNQLKEMPLGDSP